METFLGLILIPVLLIGGCCLFFLVFVQPIWSVVDVAISKEHSRGTKAVVILLTLLLLGPIITFFYACIGTRSRVLRRSTLISFVVFLLSGGLLTGLAVAVPMVKEKLPWRKAPTETARHGAAGPAAIPVEPETSAVDPTAVPTFTAVQLARSGGSGWRVAVAEFDGRGAHPQSALPVVLPGIYPLTHVAVDPKGPVYYGITTHEVGRIVPSTGQFAELKSNPGTPKPSWPAAIAYDSKRGLLLIAARSQGHSYNPATGEWQTLPWLKDDDMVALAYDAGQEMLYGLQTDRSGKAAARLQQFNAHGALVGTIPLSDPIPVGRYPDPLAQLAFAEGKLICVVSPSEKELDAGTATGVRTYLITLPSGECRPVRSNTLTIRE